MIASAHGGLKADQKATPLTAWLRSLGAPRADYAAKAIAFDADLSEREAGRLHGNGQAKAILLCLADYCDDGFACHPSLETVAEDSGFSRRTVQREIRRLQQMGFVSIERRGKQNGRGRSSNSYRLEVLRLLERLQDRVDEQKLARRPEWLRKAVKGVSDLNANLAPKSSFDGQVDAGVVPSWRLGGGQVGTLGVVQLAYEGKSLEGKSFEGKESEGRGDNTAAAHDEIVQFWNEIAKAHGLSEAKLTPALSRAIDAAMGEPYFADHWRQIISEVGKSDFLTRRKPGRDGRFSPMMKLEKILRPERIDKLLRGVYLDPDTKNRTLLDAFRDHDRVESLLDRIRKSNQPPTESTEPERKPVAQAPKQSNGVLPVARYTPPAPEESRRSVAELVSAWAQRSAAPTPQAEPVLPRNPDPRGELELVRLREQLNALQSQEV